MTKQRKDNKKPNTHLDEKTVSLVKALMMLNIPAKLISSLYGVAESTCYMIHYGARRSSVSAMNSHSAKADLTSKFNKLLEGETVLEA